MAHAHTLPTHCPHCHTPINPHNLTRSELLVFNYIASHPKCTTPEIIAALYCNRASPTLVAVHISKMRHKLRGIRIVSSRGSHATYRLIQDPQV